MEPVLSHLLNFFEKCSGQCDNGTDEISRCHIAVTFSRRSTGARKANVTHVTRKWGVPLTGVETYTSGMFILNLEGKAGGGSRRSTRCANRACQLISFPCSP